MPLSPLLACEGLGRNGYALTGDSAERAEPRCTTLGIGGRFSKRRCSNVRGPLRRQFRVYRVGLCSTPLGGGGGVMCEQQYGQRASAPVY